MAEADGCAPGVDAPVLPAAGVTEPDGDAPGVDAPVVPAAGACEL